MVFNVSLTAYVRCSSFGHAGTCQMSQYDIKCELMYPDFSKYRLLYLPEIRIGLTGEIGYRLGLNGYPPEYAFFR